MKKINFKSVLAGMAVVLGIISIASAVPDIVRYIRISRM